MTSNMNIGIRNRQPSDLQSQIPDGSYAGQERQMILRQDFYYSEYKNFQNTQYFALEQDNNGLIKITTKMKGKNQLLYLYVLFFFINCQGQQAEYGNIKRYIYRQKFKYPQNFPQRQIQWDADNQNFMKDFCAKMFRAYSFQKDFRDILKLFAQYQVFLKILVIVFRNYLTYNKITLDNNYDSQVTGDHIKRLNELFQRKQYACFFDLEKKALFNKSNNHYLGIISNNKSSIQYFSGINQNSNDKSTANRAQTEIQNKNKNIHNQSEVIISSNIHQTNNQSFQYQNNQKNQKNQKDQNNQNKKIQLSTDQKNPQTNNLKPDQPESEVPCELCGFPCSLI